MNLPDEIVAEIERICAEWDEAEKAIKLAEQVNGEIINPAIYELRYGGRRIIEAFSLLASDETDSAKKKLSDAHFDCCRARHDAIDAATSKIVSDLDIALERLGPKAIVECYPDYTSVVTRLGKVRGLVAISRENRDDRDAIYASIQADELPELVEKYREFRASEKMLIAYARSERRNNLIPWVIAVAGLLIAAASWLWPIATS